MSNKTELVGYDEHTSQAKRKEVKLYDGALKVHNENFSLLDEGITNIENSLAGTLNVKIEDLTSSLNHEHASNNKSISVGLKALTDIADPSTAVSLKADNTGNLMTSVSNITKGNAPTSAGAELQQVLMYGKKPDNTLQPLETSGDRLLVDVLELSASGRITTSTALSSVQVCGWDTGTSKFKTLNVDGNGSLSTKEEVVRTNEVVVNDSVGVAMNGSLTAGSLTSTIDLETFNSFMVVIGNHSSGGTTQVEIEGSNDNANWCWIASVMPYAPYGLPSSKHKVLNAGFRYIRILNNQGTAQSFDYIHVAKLNL